MSFLLVCLLLGVLQGLTEFLPVSSSGHLALAERWFGLVPDVSLTVFLHVGTLLAVLVYFRRELWLLVRDGFLAAVSTISGRGLEAWERPGAKLALWVLVATLPTGILGLGLEHLWTSLAVPWAVGLSFLVTAGLLWSTRWAHRRGQALDVWKAALIGGVQGLAVVPGISRSGATIAAGLWLGLDRRTAGRFSFLASVPAVAGAGLLEARRLTDLPEGHILPLVAGLGISFAVGYAALSLLLAQVEQGKIHRYAWYLVAAAAVAFVI